MSEESFEAFWKSDEVVPNSRATALEEAAKVAEAAIIPWLACIGEDSLGDVANEIEGVVVAIRELRSK